MKNPCHNGSPHWQGCSKTTIASVKQIKLSTVSTVLLQRQGKTEVDNQRFRKHNKGNTERTGNALTR